MARGSRGSCCSAQRRWRIPPELRSSLPSPPSRDGPPPAACPHPHPIAPLKANKESGRLLAPDARVLATLGARGGRGRGKSCAELRDQALGCDGPAGGPSPTAEACSHGEATSPRGASASTLGPVLGASSKSSLCPVLAPETDSPGGRNISEDPCQKAFISEEHPSSPARGPGSSPGGLGQEEGGLGQAPGRPNRQQLENPAWLQVSFGTPHLRQKTRGSRRFSSIGATALSAVGPGRPVQGPGQYSSRPMGHLPVAEEGKSSTLVEGQRSEDLTPALLQAHPVGRSSQLLDLLTPSSTFPSPTRGPRDEIRRFCARGTPVRPSGPAQRGSLPALPPPRPRLRFACAPAAL
ncbi:potassium/sodium hyperpolarization-activated cyclic nucleotide-gated channel 4-like [Mustela erminea]|uniref:potassium/sodium hyperpolarization-activated cyclic nucleotide-gated channel 4-like n=1 Tax=Mustela erminea TaxID=36723 RepID=UPI001386E761|nr:potassium/sodium hyperpolarization-activated cyclic nucleotide-gated channel 4-like [Mustela erminea]